MKTDPIGQQQRIYPVSIPFSMPQIAWFDKLFELVIFLAVIHVLGHWILQTVFQLPIEGILIFSGIVLLTIFFLSERVLPAKKGLPLNPHSQQFFSE